MTEYPKIHTIFKRDMTQKSKPLKMWDWTYPEFEYLQHNDWEFTEKVDGTNLRVMIEPSVAVEGCSAPWTQARVRFGGRTGNASLPVPLLDHLNELFSPELKAALIEAFPGGAVLYGEGIGKAIQKGIYGPQYAFVLFDVFVNDEKQQNGGWWLEGLNVRNIAVKFGLHYAPVIATGTLVDMIVRVREGIQSEIVWPNGKVPMAEGLIGRPSVQFCTRRGSRIITKLKTKDFENVN